MSRVSPSVAGFFAVAGILIAVGAEPAEVARSLAFLALVLFGTTASVALIWRILR